MEVKCDSFKAWVLAARPKTLTGAAVPVMIGLAMAWADASGYAAGAETVFSPVAAVLCLLFAFIMQIDANLVNDLFDYVKGTDDRTTRLGPERACTQGWVSVERMRHAIAGTTVLACVVGLPLVLYGGWDMVLVGVLCVLFCFLYTTHLSYMGLGDVLVLVFFGLVPVCATYYIQLHTVTLPVVVGALACDIVIDGLLLVNNFRDRDTDKVAGKTTLVVRIGAKATLRLYLCVGIAACLMGLVYWQAGHPWAFFLPLVYLAFHVSTWITMKRIYRGRELNSCLGATARNILIYGLAVALGLLI